MSSIALYRPTNTLQYPFKGLTEEYMVTKTREGMMYKNSKDLKVTTAGIEMNTGRRWNASLKLQIAEERLKHKALVGKVVVGRTGLGFCTNKDIRRATGEDYRHHLQNELRADVEELRFGKMFALDQQGAWTRWDGIFKRKVSCSGICG